MTSTNSKQYLFESERIPKAVLTLAIPTIISQLITIIYNWADTFFVGQLNNTYQIAAVTICHPTFMMATAIANLMGIGGASAISRAMGVKDYTKIKKISTISIFVAIFITLIYSLIIFLFKEPLLLNVLGADSTTIDYCNSYIFWVVVIGALPTVCSATLAHLVRSTGKANIASIGITMGAIINIILDPIFIFLFHLEITGAAIATCISNFIATSFFIIYLIKTRNNSILSFNPKNLFIKSKVLLDIILSGLSSFLMALMAIFSNASINKLMSSYSAAAISGVSIAKKVDLCILAFAQGLAHGILPLVGYNFASKNTTRMKNIIKFSMTTVLIFSITCVILFSLFPKTLVSIFIDDDNTIYYASNFLRILCLSMPLTALIFIFNTIFQATKQTGKALVTILLRKGVIDIPLMLVLNSFIPIYGVVMSQPIVDVIGATVAITLYISYLRKIKKESIELAN